MNIIGLTFHCSGCDEWFTRASIPRTEIDEEELEASDRVVDIHYCNCGEQVFDAHETGTMTPYDQLRLEVLKEHWSNLNDIIVQIERQMTDIDGERR